MQSEIRQKIAFILILTAFVSFVVSFAINNLASWSLLLLFLFQSRDDLILKVRNGFRNRLVIGFAFVMLAQILGFFNSLNHQQAIDRILSMLSLLILPTVIITDPLSKKMKTTVIEFIKILIPAIFIFLLIFHLFSKGMNMTNFVYYSLIEKLGISQFYLAIILIIPLVLGIEELLNRTKIALNLLVIGGTILVIILLRNFTAIGFLVITWLIFVFKIAQKNKRLAGLIFTLGILAFFTLTQHPIVKDRFIFILNNTEWKHEKLVLKNQYTFTKNTLEHRILISQLAFKEIMQNLPFGVGIGDVQDLMDKKYTEIKFKSGMRHNYNIHNQYLEEFLKTGIFGGFSIIFLGVSLISAVRLTNMPYTVVVICFLIGCLFESYLNRQHGVFIAAVIIPFLSTIDKKGCFG